MSYIDVLIVLYLVYLVWRGYHKGNVSNWLKLGYNVLGVGLASIYASALNKSLLLLRFKQAIAGTLIDSNLELNLSVSSGSRFPNTNLPEQLNGLFQEHYRLINSQQETIWAVSEKIIVNILGGLACYLLIWLAVRFVFFIANKFVIKVNTSGYQEHTLIGVIPTVGNALICAMLLSGILWPFLILFDHLGLSMLWEKSVILQLLARVFYAGFGV